MTPATPPEPASEAREGSESDDPRGRAEPRLIEVGWRLDADLTGAQRRASDDARQRVLETLETCFPDFVWRMPVVSRVATDAEEPAAGLLEGVQERDANAWDFAFVVTGRDLRSHYKSYALAVPSRALTVAVLSLARLGSAEGTGADRLARRVAALALHLFGDLNGLRHRDDAGAAMQAPQSVADLDRERRFDAAERKALAAALSDVADLRLEETPSPPGAAAFYLRAGAERAGEIASAVLRARPWQFPLRLGRLTAAAFSALFLLMVTAEVWDLGSGQTFGSIAALSALAMLATTGFILKRQRLLLRRGRRHLSEQVVVTHVSAVLVVLLGMAATYALLFGLTLALGLALFDPELVARWAPALARPETLEPRLALAGLIASLGLLIGSLGASFEGHAYFRHVIYADEET